MDYYMQRATNIDLPADWRENAERLGLKDLEAMGIKIHPSGIYSWPYCPLNEKEIFLIVTASGEHYKYTK